MSNRFKRDLPLYVQSGTRVGIRWVAAAEAGSTIKASVHPLPSELLQNVPEGRRKNGSYMIITNPGTVLTTQREIVTEGQQPDQVEIKGKRYEVFSVSDWENSLTVKNNEYIILEKVKK